MNGKWMTDAWTLDGKWSALPDVRPDRDLVEVTVPPVYVAAASKSEYGSAEYVCSRLKQDVDNHPRRIGPTIEVPLPVSAEAPKPKLNWDSVFKSAYPYGFLPSNIIKESSMSEQKIDIDKKYQTRDGRKVRLISNNGTEQSPIIGVIEGFVLPQSWTAEGQYLRGSGEPSALDLVPVPVTNTGYVNVYSGDLLGEIHETRALADRRAGSMSRKACVKLTYTEGQFDE